MSYGYSGRCGRANWSGALRGTACSRGIAIGLVQRVRVGERPLLHGDRPNQQRVLVTDVADARVLAVAPFRTLAVVAEAGGIGSNLAILLRELGVPAVLGVVGACAQLEDGMTVLVDGNNGVVLVLSEPLPSPVDGSIETVLACA